MKKAIAGALALCLILLSPGLECYAAVGEVANPDGPAGRAEAVPLPPALPQPLAGALDLSVNGIGAPAALPALPEEPSALQAAQASAAANLESATAAPAESAAGVERAAPAAAARAAQAQANPDLQAPAAGPADGAVSADAASSAAPISAPGRASPVFSRIHERVLAETKPWLRSSLAQAAQETAATSLVSESRGATLQAAAPDGSDNAGQSAPPAPKGPPSPRRGGIFSRARAWLGEFYRVFPDKARNKEFWLYNLAQVVINQGATFYSTALPDFVAPTKALSGRMGFVRASSFGSQLAADVAMGPSVDQKKTSSFLFKTYLGRGIFLAAVPVLYLAFYRGGGMFPTLPLIGLLVGMSFLQSAGVLAANVGFNRLLGDNPAYYNKANAANSLVVNLTGVVGPALAGAFIGWANTRFGASSGDALAFGVYGVTAVLAAILYRGLKLVNQQGQPAGQPAKPLPQRIHDLFSGQSRATALANLKAMLTQVKQGFALLWHDRFLRLTLILSTASLLIGDAIFFLAVPSYLGKIGAVTVPAFIAHAPLIGHWLAGFLGTSAAVFGLFLTASNLGATVFDVLFISRRNKSASPGTTTAAPAGLLGVFSRIKSAVDRWLGKKLGADLTPLQKQGVWSSILNGLGWVAGLSLFLTSHIWLALGVFAVSSFLQSPSVMVWSSLQQDVLNKTYAKDQAKIWSAMSVYNQIFTMAGDLIFGLVMAKFATGLALGLVMAVMGVCALLAVIQPFVVFRPAPIPGGPKGPMNAAPPARKTP